MSSIIISGLQHAMGCVRDFHREVVGCPDQPLVEGSLCGPLEDVAEELSDRARELLELYKCGGDQRYLRAHLMTEELAELLHAMSRGNRALTLDALADLLYVVLGSAVTMQLPLPEAFVEVHQSNMTKKRQSNDPDGARVRAKGSAYVPPDLDKILREWDADRARETSRARPDVSA